MRTWLYRQVFGKSSGPVTSRMVSSLSPTQRGDLPIPTSNWQLSCYKRLSLRHASDRSIAGTLAAIRSDNTPTVAWSTRMASRSGSPISFRLLRGRAMRQRTNRSAPTAVFHVTGMENILADVVSRPVTGIASHYHMFENNPSAMCPKDFLTHFTTSYPLPQQRPWLNVQPSSGLWSNVVLTLRGQRLELRLWTMKCDKLGGITGPPMQADAALTRGCAPNPSPENKPTCLPLPPGFELESSGERSKLDTSLWKKPSVTWHKPSSWPDLTTRDEATGPAS